MTTRANSQVQTRSERRALRVRNRPTNEEGSRRTSHLQCAVVRKYAVTGAMTKAPSF